MPQLTEGLDTEQIINLAAERPEFVWHWGEEIRGKQSIVETAKSLEVELLWGEPIRPGDLYLAERNTGPKILTCAWLGEACVFPEGDEYPYDFNECVKVR